MRSAVKVFAIGTLLILALLAASARLAHAQTPPPRATALYFTHSEHASTQPDGRQTITHYRIIAIAANGSVIHETAPIPKNEFTVAGTEVTISATRMLQLTVPGNVTMRVSVVAMNMNNPPAEQSSVASEPTATAFFLPAPPVRPGRPVPQVP